MHRNFIDAPPLIVEDDRVEAARLAALERFDIMDTPREEGFDRITRLICNIFDVPIAIVSMIDGHRQWYKAYEGLHHHEAARDQTFCRHTIKDLLPTIVPDALNDPRFANNPHVTGDPHIRFYAGVPLRTGDGHAIGTVCAIGRQPRPFGKREVAILSDLAQMAMDELELRRLVTVDSLTGVLSRRAFREQGGYAVALAQRHKHHLGCIVLDLDHFKLVNDRHGHAAGDKVLATVTAACRQHLRSTDLFGRLGGEEFAVLVAHTGPRGVAEVAEKLRAAIEQAVISVSDVRLGVTASFGIARLDPGMADLDALLAVADDALYQAKAAGRNRCIVWRKPSLVSAAFRRGG